MIPRGTVVHEFWLHPSQSSHHRTWGWLSGVSKFLTSSHTDIACPVGKITPHWFVEGVIKACEERSWSHDLCLVSAPYLLTCVPLLSSVQTLWIPQGRGPLLTCVCISHNIQRVPASQNPDSKVSKSRNSGTKVPRWSLMLPLSAMWTWGNYLRSLWLGFIICQVGVIIVLVSWRCYEVYIRVWPQ